MDVPGSTEISKDELSPASDVEQNNSIRSRSSVIVIEGDYPKIQDEDFTGEKVGKEAMDHKVQKLQKKLYEPAGTSNSKFLCEVCNVYCPCEIALASHKNGKKHLAKIKTSI